MPWSVFIYYSYCLEIMLSRGCKFGGPHTPLQPQLLLPPFFCLQQGTFKNLFCCDLLVSTNQISVPGLQFLHFVGHPPVKLGSKSRGPLNSMFWPIISFTTSFDFKSRILQGTPSYRKRGHRDTLGNVSMRLVSTVLLQSLRKDKYRNIDPRTSKQWIIFLPHNFKTFSWFLVMGQGLPVRQRALSVS